MPKLSCVYLSSADLSYKEFFEKYLSLLSLSFVYRGFRGGRWGDRCDRFYIFSLKKCAFFGKKQSLLKNSIAGRRVIKRGANICSRLQKGFFQGEVSRYSLRKDSFQGVEQFIPRPGRFCSKAWNILFQGVEGFVPTPGMKMKMGICNHQGRNSSSSSRHSPREDDGLSCCWAWPETPRPSRRTG